MSVRVAAVLVIVLLLVGCAPPTSNKTSPRTSKPDRGLAITFAYRTTDGETFSSSTTLGSPTYVSFLTTYDVASQVQARELNRIVQHVRPRVHAGALILEQADHQVLASTFKSALDLSFPVALLGATTYSGPFGTIDRVPVTVLLDAWGVEVWRKEGLATPRELHDALAFAAPG